MYLDRIGDSVQIRENTDTILPVHIRENTDKILSKYGNIRIQFCPYTGQYELE